MIGLLLEKDVNTMMCPTKFVNELYESYMISNIGLKEK